MSLAALEASLPRPIVLRNLVIKVMTARAGAVCTMHPARLTPRLLCNCQALVVICLTLALCAALVIVRPFTKGHEWKLRVRAMLLSLSAACAFSESCFLLGFADDMALTLGAVPSSAVNSIVSAIDLGYGSASLDGFVVAGARESAVHTAITHTNDSLACNHAQRPTPSLRCLLRRRTSSSSALPVSCT